MPLHRKIGLGLLLGAAAGVASNLLFPESPAVAWTVQNLATPVGQIFLRLIFMVVIPLIVSALALGVAELGDVGRIGKTGLRTLLFTLLFSSLAVAIGVTLVNVARPGDGLPDESRARISELLESRGTQTQIERAHEAQSWRDIVLGLIPKNPVSEMVGAFEGGLLAVMVFSLFIGVGMALAGPERAAPLKKLFESLFAVMLKIIDLAMKLAPYGVAGLIFSVTATLGWEVLSLLLSYVLVVLGGLAIHQVIVYSAALKVFGRTRPSEFFRAIREVMITAFSTSSSNATLPLALRTAEEKLRLPRPTSNFVLTVGATANQNGTALFEGVTVLFLAQFFGVDLTLGQQITVVVMSILAGVGTAGVPGGSLPLIVVILQSLGIPGEGIGIILGVDRILDMSRTVVNVSGDLAIAVCVSAMENPTAPAGRNSSV